MAARGGTTAEEQMNKKDKGNPDGKGNTTKRNGAKIKQQVAQPRGGDAADSKQCGIARR